MFCFDTFDCLIVAKHSIGINSIELKDKLKHMHCSVFVTCQEYFSAAGTS